MASEEALVACSLQRAGVAMGAMRTPLRVWIPTNRSYANRSPKGMDGWNEIVRQNRKGKDFAAKCERENVRWCAWYVKQAMLEQKWAPMRDEKTATPCVLHITIWEPNRRRDVPNIFGVTKYAIDALTARHRYGAAAIYDDSQRWLHPQIEMKVKVDRQRVGIEVVVIPLKD